MAAHIIRPTEPIAVSSAVMVVFGCPGGGKTSLAQTATAPLTLDFDNGIHRSGFRADAIRFDNWADVVSAGRDGTFAPYQTIVVDTAGRLLDLLTAHLIATDSKAANRGGGLSLQGYGSLKNGFGQWVSQLRLLKKDLVLACHEKEERDGDLRILRPEIVGGSYGEIMKFADLVGYLSVKGGKRVLDFNPTENYLGKNPVGWAPWTVPDFKAEPHFLAGLLADAKKRMGALSEASAAAAATVEEWRMKVVGIETAMALNVAMGTIGEQTKPVKIAIWHLLQQHATAKGWTWDAAQKVFIGSSAPPPVEREPGIEPEEAAA